MATGYSEPVPRGYNNPAPFRSHKDKEWTVFFDKMCQQLNQGYAITDLKALQLMSQLLYLLENHRAEKRLIALDISLPMVVNNLAVIVKLLMNFRPMEREKNSTDMEICRSMNFENCYQIFLDYIDQVSSRLVALVTKSVIESSRESFVLHLERIKFYAVSLKLSVRDKFNEYSDNEGRAENHWNTVIDYHEAFYMPEIVGLVFREFPKRCWPLPPWMLPSNSSMLNRIWNVLDTELKTTAENGICYMCYKNVGFITELSVMPYCYHVYCAKCLADWIQQNCKSQWSCPSCGQCTMEYATVSWLEKLRVVSYLIPPHLQVVTVKLRPNSDVSWVNNLNNCS